MSDTIVQTTDRTTLKRLPDRAVHGAEALHEVLDEAFVCHIGFAVEGQPYVIPTTHVRLGEVLYVHGSPASRMLRTMKGEVPLCVTVTLLDGLVLARSAFHHSMNYRSAVVFGTASVVRDREEKRRVLDALVEKVAAGRAAEVRPATTKELDGTSVLALPLDECSVKARSGGPLDDEADLTWPVWAGEVPLRLEPQPAVPA